MATMLLTVFGGMAASARVMLNSAAPGSIGAPAKTSLATFPGKRAALNRGEPAALAQSDERRAAPEIVDRHIQVAQIGVDSVISHLGGR